MTSAAHDTLPIREADDTLPDGPLVAWYGDDFTGSAAVMEALTFAGLPSVLFPGVPDAELLARFKGMRGIGIAGVARARDPQWMRQELPPVFEFLARTGAPIRHYKICSTLDSAPEIGSIGAAIDIGAPILGGAWHPFVVAAPPIGRHQAFGTLFARAAGGIYRLDRHPTMSRHPVTPMTEADVRIHLGHQTKRAIGLVDLLSLADAERAARALRNSVAAGVRIVAIDCVDDGDLAAAGRLIWRHRGDNLFAIGSQGLEYALIAYWRRAGLIPQADKTDGVDAVERIVVVSGSCAPETARQIRWAEQRGFGAIQARVTRATDERAWGAELDRLCAEALAMIAAGRDPIIFTARGPDDPAIEELRATILASGSRADLVNERIGTGLGQVLGRVLTTAGLKRGIVAGGDTSGHSSIALGIRALTALAPTIPGAALFRAWSDGAAPAGLEIALKGGQMGTDDYFHWIKSGGGALRERRDET